MKASVLFLSLYFSQKYDFTISEESGIFALFLPQASLKGIDALFVTEEWPSTIGTWISSKIVLISKLENIQLHGNEDTILVLNPTNTTIFFSSLRKVSEIYQLMQSNVDVLSWKPKILIIWSSIANSSGQTMQSELVKHTFIHQFLLDSDIYILTDDCNSFDIWEIYSLGGKIILQQIKAKLNSVTDLSFILRKSTRRGNFKGTLIKAIAMFDPDYHKQCALKNNSEGSIVGVSGLCADLLSDFQTALNFTYEIVHGNGWINQLENGSVTGIGKQVIDGEAVFSICHSLYLPYRVGRLTFLQPTEQTSAEIFFVQPELSSIRNIYASTFIGEIWFYFFLTWALIIITIKLFVILEEKFLGMDHHHPLDKERANDVLLWSVGTISQQGWYSSPSSFAMRGAVIASLLFGLIMYMGFSASLVSTLSDQRYPIKSLHDLVETDYKLVSDPALPYNTTLGALPQSKTIGVEWMSLENGIREVLSKQSAYLAFADGFRSAFERLNFTSGFFCKNIYKILPTSVPYHSGTFLRKGSEYKELFNHRIVLMKEVGLNARLNLRYRARTGGICPQYKKKEINRLGINELLTAYIILIFGFCTSFVLLIAELLYNRGFNAVNTGNF